MREAKEARAWAEKVVRRPRPPAAQVGRRATTVVHAKPLEQQRITRPVRWERSYAAWLSRQAFRGGKRRPKSSPGLEENARSAVTMKLRARSPAEALAYASPLSPEKLMTRRFLYLVGIASTLPIIGLGAVGSSTQVIALPLF